MNRLYKFLMLLVAPLFVSTILSSCSDDEDTVVIYNISHLLDLQERVNDGEYNLNAILMTDLDMSGIEWTPIGYKSEYPFNASFDGNGYTISNLTISTAASYQGLFGHVYEGTIKNVTLKDPQIKAGSYVGALCGYIIEDSEIVGCSVEGGSVEGYTSVGGLVGDAYYTDFSNCWSSASVTGLAQHVGGLVGSASASTFETCYNLGNVIGSGDYIGGFVGYPYDSEVTGCYNTGNVTGSVTSNHVGGVAGYSIYYVTACYNTGAVSGNNFIGGVVGSSMIPYATYLDSPAIIGCYNSGEIEGVGEYVAGIVGRTLSAATIVACYYVDADSSSVGVWIEDGSGVYSSIDEGVIRVDSNSALNDEVATLNSEIENYMLTYGDIDIAYRYSVGATTPTLYKF